MKLYLTVQGGSWDVANTIYFLPGISLSQISKERVWLLTAFWLFWTVGLVWGEGADQFPDIGIKLL